jgi:hypothetical protein
MKAPRFTWHSNFSKICNFQCFTKGGQNGPAYQKKSVYLIISFLSRLDDYHNWLGTLVVRKMFKLYHCLLLQEKLVKLIFYNAKKMACNVWEVDKMAHAYTAQGCHGRNFLNSSFR